MQEVELPDEAFAYNAIKSSETNDTDWDATETEEGMRDQVDK